MADRGTGAAHRNRTAKADPTEWHGHRIVTEDDLGVVFDPEADEAERVRLARRRRTRHRIVIAVLVSALLLGALFALSVLRGWIVLSEPEPAPTASAGCPAGPFTYQPPETVTVNVFNTTAAAGLAGQVSDALAERGFLRGTVGNSTVNREGMTAIIMSGPEGEAAAFTVQQQIPDTQYVQDDREGAAVDVVLGSGYTTLVPAENVMSTAAGPMSCPWTTETSPPAPAG
ncbi:LytR C-terminal domain-containing protein [Arthrobacter sp. ATA002]|uniref:LytR C-terminal domain-containing protein n=1 Tax=Arthrobacter sp. ATA002 TaxID=2991715 RepID=UPI0022A7CC0C|nr:LytR C-terminal domain-containing protein [Arthrobacter sp. ATA002]WAP51763.1 LytR C-terminal domain-containing protein [Arthrobacter sp. ATA002]